MDLYRFIRNVADFPQPGVQFKDITPLLANHDALCYAVQALAEPFVGDRVTVVAGVEARGFILGSLIAYQLGVGFVPLRKAGKLPAMTHQASYQLEYGKAMLEIHQDAVTSLDRVLLVDDLLATGGTAAASCRLLQQATAQIVACAFVIELDFLSGKQQLEGHIVHSLLHY